MTQQEMKSQIRARTAALETRFADIFEKCNIKGRACFRTADGRIIGLDFMGPYGALVIEYAENETEAKLNRFEDGDLFFLEGMDEETMFRAMLKEIGQ